MRESVVPKKLYVKFPMCTYKFLFLENESRAFPRSSKVFMIQEKLRTFYIAFGKYLR